MRGLIGLYSRHSLVRHTRGTLDFLEIVMPRLKTVLTAGSIQALGIIAFGGMAAAQSETWVNISPPGGSVRAIAIDPQTTTTIYMGGPGSGVFKTTDGGSHWHIIGLDGYAIEALVVDPHAPSIVYAAGRGEVFKSDDAGGSWIAINEGLELPTTSTTKLALDPSTSGTVYVFSSSQTTPAILYKSTDGGTQWQSASAGLPDGTAINAVAVDPTTSATLYAATGRGLFASIDGGQGWNPTGLSFFLTSVVIDPLTPSTLYASRSINAPGGSTTQGVLKSLDGGVTWNLTAPVPANIEMLAVDPQNPSTLYAGTLRDALVKTVDGGTTWEPVDTSIGDATVHAIAIDPHSPTTVYAGTGFRGVVVSTDAGANWTMITRGFSQQSVPQLALAPQSPGTIYATVTSVGGGTVMTTSDGGSSWRSSRVGLPLQLTFQSLTVDPLTPTTAYASLGGVYKTIDGGDSWRRYGMAPS